MFWFGASAALACAFVVLGMLSRSVQIGAENVAQLRTLDQRPFDELRVPEMGPSARVMLAGGVEISATAGTQLTTLAASERDVVLQLQRGAARFSMPPSAGRRWVIEAGLATVEVVGTVFEVTREAHRVSVDVSRGVVLVRSAHLPDGVARVNAGSSLNIDEPALVQAVPPVNGDDGRPGAAARQAPTLAPSPMNNGAARASTLLPEEQLPEELPQVTSSADELLARADAARVAGNLSEAEGHLKQMVTDHPTDPRRALAMFTLGVVQSQAHKPATLVTVTFRRALSLTTTASLREDCYQRLIEVELGSGQRKAAQEHLAQYQAEFPQGRHRERLQRMLASADLRLDAP
jgi:transmembrane sensor